MTPRWLKRDCSAGCSGQPKRGSQAGGRPPEWDANQLSDSFKASSNTESSTSLHIPVIFIEFETSSSRLRIFIVTCNAITDASDVVGLNVHNKCVWEGYFVPNLPTSSSHLDETIPLQLPSVFATLNLVGFLHWL